MGVRAVVGANWGDEGKGKMTDYLASKSDIVARFQGGNNAGHTIINDYGKFVLRLLPSGVFYKDVTNILGNGVALNIPAFIKERDELLAKGVPEPKILVSERAQIVMPYHKLFDEYEEERLAGRKFGSTKQGIAPFYSDKYYKIGIQVADLFDEAALKSKIEANLEIKNVLLKHLYHKPELKACEVLEELIEDSKIIKPYVCDTFSIIDKAIADKKNILLEGQLGALKDTDHGIYPFTTSSSTLAGFASVGAGIPPHEIKNIIAVVKAYSSCVGEGAFVSEIFGDEASELRERGGDSGEYGANTGRPRRMGWFDVVATRYGCKAQGATEIALTLLDVLGYLDEIPVCSAYEFDGKKIETFPAPSKINSAKPILTFMKGWKCPISDIRNYNDLPQEAKQYVEFIEKQIGISVKWISVGPKREDVIKKI